MTYFILICRDKPGALEVRLATRPSHLAYIEATGLVQAGGALLDDEGRPEGSVIIIEAENIAAARAFSENDPYALADLFASVEIKPWRLAAGKVGG